MKMPHPPPQWGSDKTCWAKPDSTDKGMAGGTGFGLARSPTACHWYRGLPGSRAGPASASRTLPGVSKQFLNAPISVPPASAAQELNFTSIFPCICRRCLLYSLRQNSRWGCLPVAGQGAESRAQLPQAPQQAVACVQHPGASHTLPSAEKSAIQLLKSQPGISAGTYGSSCEANLSNTIYFPMSLPGPCSQMQPCPFPPPPPQARRGRVRRAPAAGGEADPRCQKPHCTVHPLRVIQAFYSEAHAEGLQG